MGCTSTCRQHRGSHGAPASGLQWAGSFDVALLPDLGKHGALVEVIDLDTELLRVEVLTDLVGVEELEGLLHLSESRLHPHETLVEGAKQRLHRELPVLIGLGPASRTRASRPSNRCPWQPAPRQRDRSLLG